MTQLEQMKEQPSLQGKDLNTQMNNLWLQSLKLTPEMIELSDAEIQELATYTKSKSTHRSVQESRCSGESKYLEILIC